MPTKYKPQNSEYRHQPKSGKKKPPTGTDADLNLASLTRLFTDEDAARNWLESKRWPNGAVCPHCQCQKVYKLEPKPGSKRPVRPGVYKCSGCRKQFTVRIGTIFEESKIPISKWLMAIHLMTSSKKGVSSHQMAREIDVTVKSAWFVTHRIRAAMKTEPMVGMLGGPGKVIEADEAYIGGKPRTEDIARELLNVRGWDTARPPKGDVLRKNEYRQYPHLFEAFTGASKTGAGDGYPDFLVVDRASIEPRLVIETKGDKAKVGQAQSEAQGYADVLLNRGHNVLAVGIAGADESAIDLIVSKRLAKGWEPIRFKQKPIQWIPTREETARLLHDAGLLDLLPEVPSEEVLAKRADEISRILRECKVKDEFRPAVMAAFMLALWKSQGAINPHPEYILLNINDACQKAFDDAGKHEIAKTLHVPAENQALAAKANEICRILRLLNVTTLTSAHDYLGQLYETFFRFTGGNTIGQYFTPRHIAAFVVEMCDVSKDDMVLDPTCGTGGFLIAALYRMIDGAHLTRQQLSTLVRKHLRGFESEPITAALCVANMILRGDGSTGIVKDDCFTSDEFPIGKSTIVVGNPPFPHKKTDDPPEKFVNRGLEALMTRGTLAMVVPSSLLSKNDKKEWRKHVLKQHSLKAVIKLPDELFEPFASSYADILVLEKGKSHDPNSEVFFAYIRDDGFKIKKGVRIRRGDGDLKIVLSSYESKADIPGLCSFAKLESPSKGGLWGPGYYVSVSQPTFDDLKDEIAELIRSQIAFQVKFADKLTTFRESLDEGRFHPEPYSTLYPSRKPKRSTGENTLGRLFDIYYGQKELHNKEPLVEGDAPVISSSAIDNGCYGFFNFDKLISPPFVTAQSTGTIGAANVQLWPCGVSDDCLILIPRDGTAAEELWVAAATIRRERWRFHYGYKLTPDRIKNYSIPRSQELTLTIRKFLESSMPQMRRLMASLSTFRGGAVAIDDESVFQELADRWISETKFLSNVTKKSVHPAYQRIVGMGESAVPHILQHLRDHGPKDWFWALSAITGENPITDEIAGNMKAMSEAWLKWGTAAGYLTDSRRKTNEPSRISTANTG